MKKGISLLILVVSVLVMIILAGVIINSMQKNNPITDAKESKFKTDLAAVKESAEQRMQELMISKRGDFEINTYNRTPEEMNKFVEKMPKHLEGYVIIENGEVKLTNAFRVDHPNKVKWAEDIKVPVK